MLNALRLLSENIFEFIQHNRQLSGNMMGIEQINPVFQCVVNMIPVSHI